MALLGRVIASSVARHGQKRETATKQARVQSSTMQTPRPKGQKRLVRSPPAPALPDVQNLELLEEALGQDAYSVVRNCAPSYLVTCASAASTALFSTVVGRLEPVDPSQ